MSHRSEDYELSARARLDYEDILLYSLLTFGEHQMRKYEATLESGLRYLARHPFGGQLCPEHGPGVRRHLIGHHFAYYRVKGDSVVVARLLHERRDPAGLIDN